MIIRPLLLFLTFTITSWPSDKSRIFTLEDITARSRVHQDATKINTEFTETYSDSTQIRENGNSKVELIKYRVNEDVFVTIKFYNKTARKWNIQNTYVYECDTYSDLEPKIEDYNNDKFNDLTFISALAARGSNEVRRLFVYNSAKKELRSILNAEDYPNLRYNKELKAIDACALHGGSSTSFLRIKDDSLKPFASIENDTHRKVYKIDDAGKRTLISKDSIINNSDVFIRYKNYSPLEPLEEQTESQNDTIPQGKISFELYLAEFGGRIKNLPVDVEICGNEITVLNKEENPLTGGSVITEGILMKHKSGVWIIGKTEEDREAKEIGGCTDGPIPIDFKTKVIEWC